MLDGPEDLRGKTERTPESPEAKARKLKGNVAMGLGVFFALLGGLTFLLMAPEGEWRNTLSITFAALAGAGIIGGFLHRLGIINLEDYEE